MTECGKVKMVACGRQHKLVLCQSGRVWSSGINDNAQLGTGDTISQNNFAVVHSLTNKDVTEVACGHFNSAALTSNGELFVWGRGLHGTEDEIVTRPRQIQLPHSVVDMSLRYKHMLALTATNQVYAWGYNKYGHCGVDSTQEWIDRPKLVTGLHDYEVLQVSAGGCHSLVKCR